MHQTPWMLLCSPYSPNVVWPGRFVTDRTNPQNYFTKERSTSEKSTQEKNLENIEILQVETPSLIEGLCTTSKLSFSLASFASQYFSKSGAKVEQLKAARATRYLLVQADVRLDELSADKAVQDWLERRINRDKKKVWMITGVLTLVNAERVTVSSKEFGVGLGGAAPVLAAAGVPVLLPGLDVGADVRFQHDHGQGRVFGIPDEKVFEIQFTRVKLKSRKGESLREGLSLGSKPRWEPQWTSRSAKPIAEDDEDGEDDEYESEEELDVLEASLGDDSDDELLNHGTEQSECPVWPQKTAQ